MEFQKTPGWLDWYTGPSQPTFKLPAGAVDAHCHVFGPGTEFPYAPERKYTPCDASKHQLYALRDHLGFARNVVVQATCHGADNRAMVDALVSSGGKARGVATVKRSVSDAELQAMHDAGVRGVRFNFVKRLVDFTPKDELLEIAGRIATSLDRALNFLIRQSANTRPAMLPSNSCLPCAITWALHATLWWVPAAMAQTTAPPLMPCSIPTARHAAWPLSSAVSATKSCKPCMRRVCAVCVLIL